MVFHYVYTNKHQTIIIYPYIFSSNFSPLKRYDRRVSRMSGRRTDMRKEIFSMTMSNDYALGRIIEKVLPLPRRLSTSMRPP